MGFQMVKRKMELSVHGARKNHANSLMFLRVVIAQGLKLLQKPCN